MKHKDLIKNFTVMFRKMPYFGKAITQESDNCRYFQWPPQEDFKLILDMTPLHISIQQNGQDVLRGIRIYFSNGIQEIQSPQIGGHIYSFPDFPKKASPDQE